MKKNIVIVILSIIILVLGCTVAYLVIDNNNTKSDTITNKNSVEQNEKLSESEAINLGKELYKYANDTLWCQNYKYDDEYIENLGNKVLNYDEVVSHFSSNAKLKFLSESEYKNLDSHLIKHDGSYYDASHCSRGGNIYFVSDNLELKNIEEYKIEFNVLATYCVDKIAYDNPDCTTETKNYDFIIVKENNEWKIDTFTMPN